MKIEYLYDLTASGNDDKVLGVEQKQHHLIIQMSRIENLISPLIAKQYR